MHFPFFHIFVVLEVRTLSPIPLHISQGGNSNLYPPFGLMSIFNHAVLFCHLQTFLHFVLAGRPPFWRRSLALFSMCSLSSETTFLWWVGDQQLVDLPVSHSLFCLQMGRPQMEMRMRFFHLRVFEHVVWLDTPAWVLSACAKRHKFERKPFSFWKPFTSSPQRSINCFPR